MGVYNANPETLTYVERGNTTPIATQLTAIAAEAMPKATGVEATVAHESDISSPDATPGELGSEKDNGRLV
jgi:hypothetical protein